MNHCWYHLGDEGSVSSILRRGVGEKCEEMKNAKRQVSCNFIESTTNIQNVFLCDVHLSDGTSLLLEPKFSRKWSITRCGRKMQPIFISKILSPDFNFRLNESLFLSIENGNRGQALFKKFSRCFPHRCRIVAVIKYGQKFPDFPKDSSTMTRESKLFRIQGKGISIFLIFLRLASLLEAKLNNK